VCDKEVKLLTCVGTVQNIYYRGDMKIVHSSADVGVWTYVDWGFLCSFDGALCKPFLLPVCYCLF